MLWKVCSVVGNCSLKSSVVLHGTLHGFIEGTGGTGMLEAKLAQHLVGLTNNPHFQVSLDVRKSY